MNPIPGGDPSFESSTAGWDGSAFGATITRVTGEHHTGVAAGQYTFATGNWGYASQAMTFQFSGLTNGTRYWAGIWVKVPAGQPRVMLDVNGTVISNQNSSYNTWEELAGSFIASGSTATLRVLNYDPTTTGNHVYLDDARMYSPDPDFETSTAGWDGSDFGVTIQRVTSDHFSGSACGLLTWPGGSFATQAMHFDFTGLTIGNSYDLSVRVKVPSGQPKIYLDCSGTQIAWSTMTYGYWELLWGRFVASSTTATLRLINAEVTTNGQVAYVDNAQCVPAPTPSVTGEEMTQTLYPMQPPFDTATLPQLYEQFQRMKDVGITELVMEQLINLTSSTAYYPTSLPGVTMTRDLLGDILTAAEAIGLDVWFGLGRYWPWEEHADDVTWLNNTLNTEKFIVDELVALYNDKIAGWYLPLEVESLGATWQPNMLPLRNFFAAWRDYVADAKPGIPIMVSPFYQDLIDPNSPDAMNALKQYANCLAYIFEDMPIVAQQDGYGDVDRSIQTVETIYVILAKAFAGTSSQLWQNSDLYDVAYNNGGPMNSVKLQNALNKSGPYVSGHTSFSFASQLTPQNPNLAPYYKAYADYLGIPVTLYRPDQMLPFSSRFK